MSSEDYKRLKYKTSLNLPGWFRISSLGQGLWIIGGLAFILVVLGVVYLGATAFHYAISPDYKHVAHRFNYQDISLQVSQSDTLFIKGDNMPKFDLFFNDQQYEVAKPVYWIIPNDGEIRFGRVKWWGYVEYYLMSERREYEKKKSNKGN